MTIRVVSVMFQPDGLSAEIPYGETILTAAKKAGIILNIPCGEHGKCGKCGVLVLSGKVTLKGIFHEKIFTQEEIDQGYCLACQTKVRSNLNVYVPNESKVTNQKILVKSINPRIKPRPSLRQIAISITPPKKYSNISDVDRLLVELEKNFVNEKIIIPYSIVKQIPTILRENNWRVLVTLESISQGQRVITEITEIREREIYGLAIDVGTTTLAVNLVKLSTGKIIETATSFNSQMIYGEDVITRIHFASACNKNLQKLQELVVSDINNLIKEFSVNSEEIRTVAFSGNTVMSHLLFNINPTYIWKEPYNPVFTNLPKIKASELGLNIAPTAYVYLLPCVSSYIGGDIVSNILLSALHKKEKPSLLVDIGTNGEIVLGCNSWILSCSVPAGPALEGAEVQCGMRAAVGAIDKISLDQVTLKPKYSVIGDGKPIGICGSGLVDILAELFRANVLTKAGRLKKNGMERIRKGEHGLEYILLTGSETQTGKDIVVTEYDISNLLKTKGAFYAGYLVLLKSFDLSFEDLGSFYISGGFGNHLNIENAITIGLLPDIPHEKIKFLGNGSLGGARLALISQEKQREAEQIAKTTTNIELSNSYEFMDEYTLASFIPHTHLELFPTIEVLVKEGGIKN